MSHRLRTTVVGRKSEKAVVVVVETEHISPHLHSAPY
jgi:ribosomal protein S17